MKEVGKPGGFDHMADEELIEFIEAQDELVREPSCCMCSDLNCNSPCRAITLTARANSTNPKVA
jgi:hypothetical protein